jgi:hypothetical protein
MTPSTRTRPGIALLLALVIVVVLTAFLSELFLDTGLEVRAIQNSRDATQAQSLARSAFKAVERALKEQSEQDFVTGFRQVEALLKLSPVPFEAGLLTQLRVTSLDGLFNVNALGSIRQNSGQDSQCWALFRNALAAIPIPSEQEGQIAPPLSDNQMLSLYAALVDWIDVDENIAQGGRGAEKQMYGSNVRPEYEIKNASLDRLEEMRLIQGFVDTHLPWPELEKRFVALPTSGSTGGCVEKLDVNLASRAQIARYLVERKVEDTAVLDDGTLGPVQKNINALADKADAVAMALAPDGLDRPYFKDVPAIQTALQGAGITAASLGSFLSVCSEYLNVRVAVDVNGVVATLDAQLDVPRNPKCGIASDVKILRYTLN